MQRRDLIKSIGSIATVGITAVAYTEDAEATSEENIIHGVHTDFNPDSNKEIRRFFRDISVLSNKERVLVHRNLGDAQSQVITDIITSGEIRIRKSQTKSLSGDVNSQNSQSDNITPANHYSEESVSAEVNLRHWLFNNKLWSLEYEVEWEYDGLNIFGITEFPRPNVYDGTYSADGVVDGGTWMNDQDDEWTGRNQQKFSYIGGGTVPTLEYTPWIELTGDANGNGSVVDSGNGA